MSDQLEQKKNLLRLNGIRDEFRDNYDITGNHSGAIIDKTYENEQIISSFDYPIMRIRSKMADGY